MYIDVLYSINCKISNVAKIIFSLRSLRLCGENGLKDGAVMIST